MMSKPAKFILNSDYATLANDSDTTTITVTIPATSISSGVSQVFTNTVIVGTIGSPIEFDVNYSMSDRIWKTPELLFVENSTLSSAYQGYINVYKSDANTVTVQVMVFYGGSGSITKNARTVTVKVRTFIPPFS